MADVQPENGYTKLVNTLLEALIKSGLSGKEMALFLYIARRTYGYGNKTAEISYQEMADATGMLRQNAYRSMQVLLSRKITHVIKDDNKKIQVFGINKDYDKWEPVLLSRKITKKKKIVIKDDNKMSSPAITKPTPLPLDKRKKKIKENKQKKKFIPPSLEEVISFFLEKKFPRELAVRAFDHYDLAEPPWTDTKGTPVRSWKQKMSTVWMTTENKKQSSSKQDGPKPTTFAQNQAKEKTNAAKRFLARRGLYEENDDADTPGCDRGAFDLLPVRESG